MARLYSSMIAATLVGSAVARRWIPAAETPMGLMANAGMSPKPTEAPGSNGIPKELLRRQNHNYVFPPPDNWCGFINGAYSNPLSCSADYTCVNSGAALGCCTATTGTCDNIWTACIDYGNVCDSNCQGDVSIKRCNSELPFCGTYSFFGGTYLYNCQSTVAFIPESVEFLNDFYSTAIGSTIPGASSASFLVSRTGTPTTVTKGPTSPAYTSSSLNNAHSAAIGAAAIGGICVGVGVLSIVLGVIIFLCIRRRRNNRIKQAQQQTAAANPGYGGPPPMQQQSPGYQPVPQQDGQYLSPGQTQQPPSYAPTQQGYLDPSKSPATTYATPVSPGSTHDPRQSTFAGSGIVSPAPTTGPQQPQSPVQGGDLYYKPPSNPNTMEVDGTQGNPGVPHGGQQQFQEVDGTQGNPGVPHHQGQQPYGPYEVQ